MSTDHFDLLITGGELIDGTGTTAYSSDVGIRDDAIIAIGDLSRATADRTIDATDRIVCPGFIDPHTHYDAQILWDPAVTPSTLHGVTTVVMGNCGFSIAPLGNEADATYIREMLTKVEGMSLESLMEGADWSWRSFPDYLARVNARTAVNVCAMVGHSAVRRTVMGDAAIGATASPEQVEQMATLVREAIEAGAIGFSTTQSFTHSDLAGEPVPSRWAERDELIALAAVCREYEGTSLEWVTDGCLNGFTNEEVSLMAAVSAAADRPLNWNVLTIDSARPDDYREQLAASDQAAANGGRIVALTMPVLVGMNMSFGSYCALHQLPGWKAVLGLPIDERMERLRDPVVRELLAGAAAADASVFSRLTGWERYRIGDTYSAANDGLKDRLIGDLAAERGTSPFDTLLDVVLADDLRTVLWPGPTDDDDASWQLRRDAWDHPDVMIGGSDAGAHLDRMAGASYTTEWLDDVLHGQKLTTLPNAIRHLTQVPAQFYGLHDRGAIAVGKRADVVVFNPATVASEPVSMQYDLPGGAGRLFSNAIGIDAVVVNGETIISDGEVTGTNPGRVLRSGTDTIGTSVSAHRSGGN